MKLALSQIIADVKAQPRAEMNVEVIDDYSDHMRDGDKFPPIVVFHDGAKYWLADGFHRYHAAIGSERTEINCDVRVGGLIEAEQFSCGANASHGLRRTNEDKRRAVFKVLAHPEWSTEELSTENDTDVARLCAVTQPFVSKMRREFNKLNENYNDYSRKVPVTNSKTGERTTRTFSTRDDAKKDGAVLVKSLGEIARQIDLMPSPRDVVANFPAAEANRFPYAKLVEMAEWLTALAEEWRLEIEKRGKAA